MVIIGRDPIANPAFRAARSVGVLPTLLDSAKRFQPLSLNGGMQFGAECGMLSIVGSDRAIGS